MSSHLNQLKKLDDQVLSRKDWKSLIDSNPAIKKELAAAADLVLDEALRDLAHLGGGRMTNDMLQDIILGPTPYLDPFPLCMEVGDDTRPEEEINKHDNEMDFRMDYLEKKIIQLVREKNKKLK